MSSPPPDLPVTPPYQPTPYLVSGPGAFLTCEELVRYFEDFHSSLECVKTDPQMVFERLIGNLSLPVQAAIRKARRASATEDSVVGITSLEVPAHAVSALIALPPAVPVPAVPCATNLEEEVRQTPLHVIRSFSAQDCSEWDAASVFEYTKAFLTTGKADLSRFAIALTSFQMPNSAQLIASASITTPQDTGYSVALSNSGPTGFSSCLQSASCSWIELDDYAPDMQCGVWSLPQSPGSDRPQNSSTHKIDFPMIYNEIPQVLVWLRGLHLSRFNDRSLRLSTSSIKTSGFDLQVTALATTIIHDIEISWLACSARKSGITIGEFQSGELPVRSRCEGYVAFERDRFQVPPRVAVGITGFEINKNYELCLSVQVVQVTSEGMKWRMDTGKDGNMKNVRGTLIAIE